MPSPVAPCRRVAACRPARVPVAVSAAPDEPAPVQFLRRLAVIALLVAVLLLVLPRLLTVFGVLGPSARRSGLGGERAGRGPELRRRRRPALVRGPAPRCRKRRPTRAGRAREARRAADRRGRARSRRSARRSRAATRSAGGQKPRGEIDRQLNELEDLYGRAVKVVDKEQEAELLALMKSTRQAGRPGPALRAGRLRPRHGRREGRLGHPRRGARGPPPGPESLARTDHRTTT